MGSLVIALFIGVVNANAALAKSQIECISESTQPTNIPKPLVTPASTCEHSPKKFMDNLQQWNLKNYNPKPDENNYFSPLPIQPFPLITYNASLSANLKIIELSYLLRNDDKTSTVSASLYLSFHLLPQKLETGNKIFELNIPEPNVGLIEFKSDFPVYDGKYRKDLKESDFSSLKPHAPIRLKTPMVKILNESTSPYESTLTISPEFISDNIMQYSFKLHYYDKNFNSNQITDYRTIRLPTNPKDTLYYLEFGTSKFSSIYPIQYRICDLQ